MRPPASRRGLCHRALLLFAVALLCTGCSAQQSAARADLTDGERQWLEASRGDLVYAELPDYPPIEFVNDAGDHVGLTADYLRTIEESLGITFRRVRVRDWADLIDRAQRGSVDVVGSIQDTPERRAFLDFTSPYVEIPNSIIVREDRHGSLSLKDLRGMRVVMVKGYASIDYVRRDAPEIHLIPVSDSLVGLQRVSFGQADAFVSDLSVASYYIDQQGISNLRVAGDTKYSWKLTFGCRRDRPELCSILDKSLATIKADERGRIYRRWISLRPERLTDRQGKLLLAALLAITASFAGIAIWNRALKRQVLRRTQALTQELAERKRAEQALREQKENLRITLNSLGDAVVAMDASGLVVRMNPEAERQTGWSQEEAHGKPMREVIRLLPAGEADAEVDPSSQALTTADPVSSDASVLLARDGSRPIVSYTAAAIRDESGEAVGAVLVLRNVTEAHRLREQLHQSRKLDSIGRLAGGVAHDFNNLLGGIIGYAELLQLELPNDPIVMDYADNILRAGDRARQLTQQLLSFSRAGKLETKPIDVRDIVKEVFGLLKRSIDPRIELLAELSAEPAIVAGDASQLQNALLNLCVNARDAMPEGGRLTVSTRVVAMDEEEIGAYSDRLPAGRYVSIDVADTGTGIPLEHQSRIFEPFFTTKREGEGTGLGLAGVYGCVVSHHGEIRVLSQPGEGSTFKILLPLSDAVPQEQPVGEVRPRPGTGRVLVVDDDDRVRAFTAKCLGRLGYEVTACAGGPEAVALVESAERPFDLAILDLVMPRMSGVETFRRLRQRAPGIRILLVSGFSEGHASSELLAHRGVLFLPKPFRFGALAQAVATCLDAKHDPGADSVPRVEAS